jgi:hypothetical protein
MQSRYGADVIEELQMLRESIYKVMEFELRMRLEQIREEL